MKTLRGVGIGIASVLLLTAGTANPSWASMKLKMATEGKDQPPPAGLKHRMPGIDAMKHFAELVEEKSNGEIDVEAFFGTMGPAKQLFGSVQLGTLDIVVFSSGILSYFKGGENLSLLWAPFLFDNLDEFNAWVASDMAKGLMTEIEKNMGFTILGPLNWRTSRMLTTVNTPIWSMADIKGLKFRVPPSKIFTDSFAAWGSIPTPMPFTELFMALKQDVIQGQDNGFDVVVPYQFYTVQKYGIITDHMMGSTMLAMNKSKWDSLTPDQQKIIQEAREEVMDWQKPLFNEALAEALQFAASQGMRFIIPDLTEFKKASRELNIKLDEEGSIWEKGLYKKVEAWLIQNFRQ